MDATSFTAIKRPSGTYFDNLSYSQYKRNTDGEFVKIEDDFTVRAYQKATKYVFAFYAPDFEKNGCPDFFVAAFSIDKKHVDNVKNTLRYLVENHTEFV